MESSKLKQMLIYIATEGRFKVELVLWGGKKQRGINKTAVESNGRGEFKFTELDKWENAEITEGKRFK